MTTIPHNPISYVLVALSLLSAHCFVGYARAEDCSLDGGDMMKKAAANSARAVAVADTTTTANSTPHTVTHRPLYLHLAVA